MTKVLKNGFFVAGMLLSQVAWSQKAISEITMVYDITVQSNNQNPAMAEMFNGATTTVYIKGNSHRTESVNNLGTTTAIYDGKANSGVVLKEYGSQKILVRMTGQNWKDANKKYDGVVFTPGTDTKTIAGYLCRQATGKLKDGTEFTVYYTSDIVPENKDYSAQFSSVNGLVLQYEFQMNKMKVINTVSRVTLSTIPTARFDIPKTGYREMTYEESQKIKN